MSEWFQSLGPVQWFRDQFAECPEGAVDCDSITAPDMFQFVLLAWAVAAIVLIALDRLGSGLFGRSRPLAQEPPVKARAWRWGRQALPANYSLLPPGTTVQSNAPAVLTMEIVDRPALTSGETPGMVSAATTFEFPGVEVSDDAYWKTVAASSAPLFGRENDDRLRKGLAPERYNPVSGRVESLHRDDSGHVVWPWSPKSTLTIGIDTEVAPDAPVAEESSDSSVFGEEEE